MPDTNQFSIALEGGGMTLRLSQKFDRVRYQWDTQRHCNAEYELHIILSGQCRLEVENDSRLLSSAQALIIAPGCYHYPSVLPGPFERLSLSFMLTDGPLLQSLRQRAPVSAGFQASEEILSLCRSIHLHYDRRAPYRRELISSLLTSLAILVLRELLPAASAADRPSEQEAVRIDLIDQYFVDHFAESGGEETLASLLHLSRRQLARVLQAHYGMGFRQKLIRTRMDRAAWLLRTSDRKVSEIAFLTGYTSEAAFYQVFRKEFRMTPSQYRKKH